jgi:hypothetical protein
MALRIEDYALIAWPGRSEASVQLAPLADGAAATAQLRKR